MKSDLLDRLEENWENCSACGAMLGRDKVHWRGDPDSPLALIGESPGAEEEEQGAPFVGPAGRKLDEALRAAGVDPTSVFIANVIACRPPGDRAPTVFEARNCSARLQEMLKIVDPKALLLLGATAGRLAGSWSVEPDRGKVRIVQAHCYDGKTRAWPAFVTYHPAFVLRAGDGKNAYIIDDIRLAWNLALARRDKSG